MTPDATPSATQSVFRAEAGLWAGAITVVLFFTIGS